MGSIPKAFMKGDSTKRATGLNPLSPFQTCLYWVYVDFVNPDELF